MRRAPAPTATLLADGTRQPRRRTSWAERRLLSRPGALRLQEQRAQRRKREREAVRVAVHADRRGVDAAEVALPAPAVKRGVAVQELVPAPGARDADLVVVSRHGREVEDGRDQVVGAAAAPEQADHALLAVGHVDPREAGRVEVQLVQRLLLAQ